MGQRSDGDRSASASTCRWGNDDENLARARLVVRRCWPAAREVRAAPRRRARARATAAARRRHATPAASAPPRAAPPRAGADRRRRRPRRAAPSIDLAEAARRLRPPARRAVPRALARAARRAGDVRARWARRCAGRPRPTTCIRRAEMRLDGGAIWDSGDKPVIDDKLTVVRAALQAGPALVHGAARGPPRHEEEGQGHRQTSATRASRPSRSSSPTASARPSSSRATRTAACPSTSRASSSSSRRKPSRSDARPVTQLASPRPRAALPPARRTSIRWRPTSDLEKAGALTDDKQPATVEAIRAALVDAENDLVTGNAEVATARLFRIVEAERFAKLAVRARVRQRRAHARARARARGRLRVGRALPAARARARPEVALLRARLPRHGRHRARDARAGGAARDARSGGASLEGATCRATRAPSTSTSRARSPTRQNDLPGAEAHFANVDRQSRFFAAALYFRGLAHARKGHFAAARASLCEIVEQADQDRFTFFIDGRYYAIKDLAYLALGRIAHEQGKYDDSYYFYFRVPEDSDRLPDALFEASWSMFQKQEYEAARRLPRPVRPLVPQVAARARRAAAARHDRSEVVPVRSRAAELEELVRVYEPIEAAGAGAAQGSRARAASLQAPPQQAADRQPARPDRRAAEDRRQASTATSPTSSRSTARRACCPQRGRRVGRADGQADGQGAGGREASEAVQLVQDVEALQPLAKGDPEMEDRVGRSADDGAARGAAREHAGGPYAQGGRDGAGAVRRGARAAARLVDATGAIAEQALLDLDTAAARDAAPGAPHADRRRHRQEEEARDRDLEPARRALPAPTCSRRSSSRASWATTRSIGPSRASTGRMSTRTTNSRLAAGMIALALALPRGARLGGQVARRRQAGGRQGRREPARPTRTARRSIPPALQKAIDEREGQVTAARREAIRLIEDYLRDSPKSREQAEALYKLAELYWEESKAVYLEKMGVYQAAVSACHDDHAQCPHVPRRPPTVDLVARAVGLPAPHHRAPALPQDRHRHLPLRVLAARPGQGRRVGALLPDHPRQVPALPLPRRRLDGHRRVPLLRAAELQELARGLRARPQAPEVAALRPRALQDGVVLLEARRHDEVGHALQGRARPRQEEGGPHRGRAEARRRAAGRRRSTTSSSSSPRTTRRARTTPSSSSRRSAARPTRRRS